ncbi:TIGR02221 family CRISPR-associated protein [Rhodothermus profundi]|uniref:CRISPR-associated protein, TM1812 family n=1 Tax=Rhodothermus profundi TaxID=633813 RepID=A0A1M6SMS7_9BACT|nr:TIGR02221 family CRISPR-associated protein [Rhodothermus profundi]SHK46013.1 CRISPR-associated protein, TM1812 family [Rhodothermus profundi]
MRVQISFLGIGNYQCCTYCWEDQRHTTRYFQEAVYRFFRPERCLIFMTREAEEKHGCWIKQIIEYEPVYIPEGKNEEELWEIFNVLTHHIADEDILIVDVTHGLRTQPMLSLAALYYLRVTRNVEIERIVYGAYDARNHADEAPVFDLTPFLRLIEWSVAAHLFIRYGQAGELAQLLREIHRLTYVESTDTKARHAQRTAGWLEGFSRGMSLVRLTEVLQQHARQLPQALQQVREDILNIPRLRPFGLLLDQTARRVQPLQHPHPYSYEGLQAQAALIRLLLNFGLVQQAITVAREAMVTRQALDAGYDPLHEREKAEEALNQLAKGLQDPETRRAYTGARHALAKLWNELTNVRNDINHAGMRAQPLQTDALFRRACELAESAAEWIERDVDQSE